MVSGNIDWSDPVWGRYPMLEKVARRCAPYVARCTIAEDGVGRPEGSARLWLLANEPAYQYTEIEDGPHARFALAAPFEGYRSLRDAARYEAIWSPTLGAVECELSPYVAFDISWEAMRPRERHRMARRLLGRLKLPVGTTFGEDPSSLESKSGESVKDYNLRQHALSLARREARKEAEERPLDPTVRAKFETYNGAVVSLGPSSDAWAVWYQGDVENPDGASDSEEAVVWRTLTLRLEGVRVPDEARATEILERLGDTALFEVDRASGVGLRLVRSEIDLLEPGVEDVTVARPLPTSLEAEYYDPRPMSLYRYGRLAQEFKMPLLAFLAFYQVLEFYYPAYSPSARKDAVREKLIEIAAFEVKDSDVEEVLKAAGLSKKVLYPDERQQLSHTLARCVEPAKLGDFLADKARALFYASEESLELSEHGLPAGSAGGKRGGRRRDHSAKVAQRIYEIRNRIVHTKSQHDEKGPLLPFDTEARLLAHDVSLVRFLAQEVLVASARGPVGPPPLGNGRPTS